MGRDQLRSSAEVILSAELLTSLQRCHRLYALSTVVRPPRRRPKEVLDSLLRSAILQISSGASVQAVSAEATTRFLEAAAKPGLDTHHNPYTLARDFCAIIENVLEAVSRTVLLKVDVGPDLNLGAHSWRPSAFQDESGLLHRWTTVERWDDDAKFRELHSWYCFGDCAAAEVGMTLHVIEIGTARRSHQSTPWARTYKHPVIAGHFKFQKTDGSPLEPSWKPVWYQDSSANNPKAWVDQMERDNVWLIHHLNITEPRPEHVEQFRREVAKEATRMADTRPWLEIPMSRPSCDMPWVCPFQDACYAPPGFVDLEALGYHPIAATKS